MKLMALLVLIQVSTAKPVDPNVGVCPELTFHELIFMSQNEVQAIAGIRQADIPIQPSRREAAPQDPRVEELRKTLDDLKKLKSIGREDQHPDVMRLNHMVQQLEKDMTPEQIARAKEPLPPITANTR